jgi:hypothetical protein
LTSPYGSGPQYPDPHSGGFPHQQPGYYGGGNPYQQPPRNNGLAIASMVLSLCGIVLMCASGVGLLPALIGVILGHVAKGQIRRDGTRGDGMATTGLVVGYIVIGLVVGAFVLLMAGLFSPFLFL